MHAPTPDMSAPPLSMRDRLNRRHQAMKNERANFDPHIKDIGEHFRPRRTRFSQSERNTQNVRKFNHIIDNTGVHAANVLRSGLVNGLSNPTQAWFRYEPEDLDLLEYGPAKAWLAMLESLVKRIFQASNFYESMAIVYDEVALFGTACAIVEDDFEDVIRMSALTFGEYWLASDHRRVVDSCYRELTMTVIEAVEKFGLKNVSGYTKNAYDAGNYQNQIPVMHAIEPNHGRDAAKLDAANMPWRSLYWEPHCEKHDKFLRRSGYRQNPLIAPRWSVIGHDVYGSSCPGMEALGDVRQLQIQQKRKGTAIDKQVNPPMQRPASLADRFISTLPGADNVVPDASQAGARPLYEVNANLKDMNEDVAATQARVDRTFFVPYILAISSMEGVQPKNQMEIMERKGEGLAMLGPAIGRIQNEALNPVHARVINRIYDICMPLWQMGEPAMLPPPPPELQGMPIRIELMGALALVQKAAAINGVERLIGVVTNPNVAQAFPNALDKIDGAQMVDELADMLGVPTKMIRSDEALQQLAAQRAEQEKLAQLQAGAPAMKDMAMGLKALGETPVGGGKGALQNIMENAGLQQPAPPQQEGASA